MNNAPSNVQLKAKGLKAMNEKNVKKETGKSKITKILVQAVIYIFLFTIAIIVIFPFYYMIISSLKDLAEYKRSVPTLWPEKIHLSNYIKAFDEANLGILFKNTLYVGVVSTILSLVITVISAFAFARLEFKGKNLLFTIMLATMMIPGELFTITNYVTTSNFGWRNTYIIMILPFLISFYYIFLLRNAFMQIPDSLYKAAKVDGCSDLGYLVKVMVPLTAPTLISITLLKLIGTWNSYIWPRLVNSESWRLISNWVMQGFVDADGSLGYGTASGESINVLRMAATCMVTLPLLILFICFRKYIMSGVSKSGTKG